jgi:hypothetical protein
MAAAFGITPVNRPTAIHKDTEMNTHLQTSRLTALACLALLCAAPAAHAGLVTFDFSGTITQNAAGSIDPFAYTGHYSFESAQLDLNPDDLRQGNYQLSSIEVMFGDRHLVAASSFNDMSVENDVGSINSPVDAYSVFGTSSIEGGLLALSFIYDSNNVFQDDSLRLTPPPLAGLANASRALTITGFGIPDIFFGSVDSLTCSHNCDGQGGGDEVPKSVPEPSTLIGLAMTLPLLGLGRLRRRRPR